MFTAVSGSGGTQLRFSTASPDEIARDPSAFIAAQQYVNIAPDCLFTVRLGGGVWHQFVPLDEAHPAMFALSCHTNELGGDLPHELRQRVLAGDADIPSLTEIVPPALRVLLDEGGVAQARNVPTYALSLDAAPESWLAKFCRLTRGTLGHLRGRWGRWRRPLGYLADNAGCRDVRSLDRVPCDSLLRGVLEDHTHEDTFELTIAAADIGQRPASAILADVLDGFLENRPLGVSRLMSLRNALVRPLGLRTSPLGCPVSSLLAPQAEALFAGRFPVRCQRIDALDRRAEVILGADDRHLIFRSCVGVVLKNDASATVMLGTRVRTHNAFGRAYMALVDRVHRTYIAPSLLGLAVDHAVRGWPAEAASH